MWVRKMVRFKLQFS